MTRRSATSSDERRGLVVVKAPVAVHVSFPERPRAGGNAYPQSLMGVIAFVRQAFLDAQHYGVARSARQTVADDPAMEALLPAVDRKMPVAFEANQAREILRALKLAKELTLEPIVTGGREADEVAAELKSQGVRVIYSLNYPERPKALAPDADEPIHTLRQRANAANVPGELAKAGVAFAFESAGLNDAKDFVKNAAKAVKAGLPEDAALRALTIGAATMAGVGDRLGSIEKGKVANLVVTDGNLFDEKTKVTRVFIEGRSVSLEAPTAAATAAERRRPLARSSLVGDCPGLGEDIDVLGDNLEVDRLELRTHGIADLADRALAVDEVHDLVGDIVAVRQARDRDRRRAAPNLVDHPLAVRCQRTFHGRLSDRHACVI